MCLFWLVLGLFWVEVGGGVFILVSIGWVYFEWWWVFFGWWWVLDGIFRVVVGDGVYFLGGGGWWHSL